MGIKKLPADEKILSEIENLQSQQTAEKECHHNLIKQQSELPAILSNFESLLESTNVVTPHRGLPSL